MQISIQFDDFFFQFRDFDIFPPKLVGTPGIVNPDYFSVVDLFCLIFCTSKE